LRICSRISAALTGLIYGLPQSRQAAIAIAILRRHFPRTLA
jgi:hypothetical protein